MKRLLPLLLLVAIIFGCGKIGYYCQQEIRQDDSRILCKSGACLTTYVWHNGEIIKVWYDDINSVDDSTKIKRRQQAKELIKNLKK